MNRLKWQIYHILDKYWNEPVAFVLLKIQWHTKPAIAFILIREAERYINRVAYHNAFRESYVEALEKEVSPM